MSVIDYSIGHDLVTNCRPRFEVTRSRNNQLSFYSSQSDKTTTPSFIAVKSDSQVYSFIADVALDCNIIWTGQIRATWNAALALAEPKDGSDQLALEMPSDGYLLSLRLVGSKQTLQTASTFATTLEFGGIVMGADYEVEIVCVFGEREIPCGSKLVGSSKFRLIQSDPRNFYSILILYFRPSVAQRETERWCPDIHLCRDLQPRHVVQLGVGLSRLIWASREPKQHRPGRVPGRQDPSRRLLVRWKHVQ